mgnify:CR=1 FL=1
MRPRDPRSDGLASEPPCAAARRWATRRPPATGRQGWRRATDDDGEQQATGDGEQGDCDEQRRGRRATADDDGQARESGGGSTLADPPPLSGVGQPAAAAADAGGADTGEGRQSLLEWPANLATGGILFVGDMQPAPSAPLTTGEAPTPAETHRGTGPADIRLYVDYRCPYCSLFEQANAPKLEELVRSGRATLEVVPLTFLDRLSSGTAYSSRAAGALMCVVDGQPEGAWAAHSRLLSPEVQPEENTPGLDDDEIAAVLDDATGGLSPAVRECVTTGRFASFASAFGEWAGTAAVPNAVDPGLTVAGTPFAVVNGVPYAGHPADHEEFLAFLSEQGL